MVWPAASTVVYLGHEPQPAARTTNRRCPVAASSQTLGPGRAGRRQALSAPVVVSAASAHPPDTSGLSPRRQPSAPGAPLLSHSRRPLPPSSDPFRRPLPLPFFRRNTPLHSWALCDTSPRSIAYVKTPVIANEAAALDPALRPVFPCRYHHLHEPLGAGKVLRVAAGGEGFGLAHPAPGAPGRHRTA